MGLGGVADIKVDQSSGVPVWLQLNNQIASLIYMGALPPGSQLPTVRELAVQAGVNYNTVSKVYQNLEREGLIVSRRGKGSFVQTDLPPRSEGSMGEGEVMAADFVDRCRELGLTDEMILGLVSSHLRKG